MLDKRRFKKKTTSKEKPKMRFKKHPTIKAEVYDLIRESYLQHGNMSRAARDASVTQATASRWINNPHPLYSPEMSIDQWAQQISIRSTELVVEQTAQLKADLTHMSRSGMDKIMAAHEKAVFELDGVKKSDGTTVVNSDEMGKSVRVLKQLKDIHEDVIKTPRQKQEEKEERQAQQAPVQQAGPTIQGDVNVTQVNVQQPPIVFQGQTDVGHKFDVPENPQTLFEQSLAFMNKHKAVFADEGGDNQKKLEDAMIVGHNIRDQHESREDE